MEKKGGGRFADQIEEMIARRLESTTVMRWPPDHKIAMNFYKNCW